LGSEESALRLKMVSASSGAGGGAEAPLGKVEIDGRLFQVGMTQQHLNGAQVGAGFQQMSREAVAKRVGVKLFPDPRAFGGFAASVPDDLGADGILGGGMPPAAREQPLGRFPAQR
jgi:hypothetical protein